MTVLAPPPRTRILNELLTWVEFPRLAFNAGNLLRSRASESQRVIVFPGFGAGNASTATLRSYLAHIGHEVSGWQLGTNNGDVENMIHVLRDWVALEHEAAGRPVHLVGWSLGGYLAREVARELPGAIASVITLGSPVRGGPKYTQIAGVYADRGYDLDEIEQAVLDREAVPLTVPVTAIYSRLDGIVAWEACIDDVSDNVDHIEVTTTHTGLGFNAEVYRLITDRLNLAPIS